MIKVLLVDDEVLARSLLRSLLAHHEDVQIVGEAGDGFEALKLIQTLRPDLLFLDVQMPKVTGFELLELLEQPPAVIFSTAFDEYAIKAFDTHAVDYLLKPITKERVDKALARYRQMAPAEAKEKVDSLLNDRPPEGYEHRIVVKDGSLIRIVPTTEVQYLEASDDYVKIYTKEGKWLKKITLTKLEALMDPAQFVRVHRSYMIPVSQLQRIEPYEKDSHLARLHCGAQVPVSKAGMSRLRELLGW
jgi:two-component system LytT family response regulator